MRIVQINRLRLHAATRATTEAAFIARVRALFDEMDGFDLQAWSKGRSFANEAITLSLGRVFLVAVRLYAIMTLCRFELISSHTVGSHSGTSGLGASTQDAVRQAETRELVKLLRQLWPSMKYIPALQWPMIVAGVGIAGSRGPDWEFIDECLLSIWHYPLNDTNIFRCLEKLRVF